MTAEDRARQHFDALSREEQIKSIFWLADIGFSEHGIAHATRLSVEMIRRILGQRTEHGQAQ